MPKNIHNVLLEGKAREIKKLPPDALLGFKDAEYKNVFLFVVRNCSVGTVKAVTYILKHSNKTKFSNLIIAYDLYGRTALMLAAIANNVDTLSYLHRDLRFVINCRNRRNNSALTYAISRNSRKTFNYLLLNGADFTKTEKDAIGENSQFRDYFNSPECFLIIIESKNIKAFTYIVRHIKTATPQRQNEFISTIDDRSRNALILAAYLDLEDRFIQVLLDLYLQLDSNLGVSDYKGKTALTYLIKNDRSPFVLEILKKQEKISSADINFLGRRTENLPLNTQKARKEWGKALTFSPKKIKQAGKLPHASKKLRLRPYRSFSSERERQLLRQVATQVYFHLDENYEGKNLQEVEIMHLVYGDKHSLFVAVNEHSVSKYLPRLIESMDNFKKLLCKGYTQTRKGTEGKLRSKRYANKLAYRVFGNTVRLPDSEDANDQEQAKQVATLLKTATLYNLPFVPYNNQKLVERCLNTKSNAIYLVVVKAEEYPTTMDMRHAEEFLCDIADHALALGKNKSIPVYSCIAGKKRPCIGCSGRMRGRINHYGERPGLFWQHTLKNQSSAVAQTTLQLLCTERANVSVAKNGRKETPEFDSGSDSEDEKTIFASNFLSMAPWCTLLEDQVISKTELMTIPPKELTAIAKSGDIELLLREGYSLQELKLLYQENPTHIKCTEYAMLGNLEELLLENAPNVNPIVMHYAKEYDADIHWVREQLCETDQLRFDLTLSYCFPELDNDSEGTEEDSNQFRV